MLRRYKIYKLNLGVKFSNTDINLFKRIDEIYLNLNNHNTLYICFNINVAGSYSFYSHDLQIFYNLDKNAIFPNMQISETDYYNIITYLINKKFGCSYYYHN